MRNLHYILVDGQPVAEPDILKWARWFDHTENRIVAKTEALPGVEVSTVFLGTDHNFSESGEPILWETMIFRDGHGEEQWRYTSREAAEEHHARLVAHLKEWYPAKADAERAQEVDAPDPHRSDRTGSDGGGRRPKPHRLAVSERP